MKKLTARHLVFRGSSRFIRKFSKETMNVYEVSLRNEGCVCPVHRHPLRIDCSVWSCFSAVRKAKGASGADHCGAGVRKIR